MFRVVILFVFCLFFISCKNEKEKEKTVSGNKFIRHQNLKDYIDFKYDKVIAFATVNPMEYSDIGNNIDLNKFNDTISIRLNYKQIHSLNNILSGKENNNNDDLARADCFYPRHNIIFLNKNTIVHYILICFECNDVKSSKPAFASMKNYEDFFNSLGLKVFHNPFEHATYYDSIKPLGKQRFK